MKVIESSSIGDEVLKHTRQSIVLGLSINNSYFKDENISRLLSWAQFYALSIFVMIPDEPMISTFVALGYDQEKAKRTARLKGNTLENRVCRILNRLNLDSVKIIRWKQISSDNNYLKVLAVLEEKYLTEDLFKCDIQNSTKSVLRSNGLENTTGEAVEIGTKFLLKELAFITYADVILSNSQNKVAYVYHKTTEILKAIIDCKYSFSASPNVGFITVV